MSFQHGGETLPPSALRDAPSVVPKLQPGEVLGSYELVAMLGSGAMGEVYLARHVRLGRNVAIKVLKPEHVGNTSLVQRFFQEARAVNQINHQHIVEVYDFIEELGAEGSGRVYCVMELLTGRDLGQVVRERKLSVARVVAIGRQICAALGAAHDVGVVHRDLKPDNVFIVQRPGEPDFVKVLDFGVAKLANNDVDRSISTTTEGAMVGTPRYMSPEQAASLEVDPRTDIYALGCVLYEMLAGTTPFGGKPFGPLIADILTQPPPPLPSAALDGGAIPELLTALVVKCLEKKPEARPRSMAEVAASLEVAERAAAPTLRLHPARSVQRWVFGAGAGVVVVLGFALALRGGHTPSERSAAPPAAAPAPRPETPAPAPVRVHLRITSVPSGANVFRSADGQLVGATPLQLEPPRESGQLAVRVERDGYQPAQGTLSLSKDGELSVKLLPAKPRSRSTPSAAPKKQLGDDAMDPYAQ